MKIESLRQQRLPNAKSWCAPEHHFVLEYDAKARIARAKVDGADVNAAFVQKDHFVAALRSQMAFLKVDYIVFSDSGRTRPVFFLVVPRNASQQPFCLLTSQKERRRIASTAASSATWADACVRQLVQATNATFRNVLVFAGDEFGESARVAKQLRRNIGFIVCKDDEYNCSAKNWLVGRGNFK